MKAPTSADESPQPFELIERIEHLERFFIRARNRMKMMKKSQKSISLSPLIFTLTFFTALDIPPSE
jgi:hypothetical protein